MNQILDKVKALDKDKLIKYGTLATAALCILYVVYYYFSHCFSLNQSFRYNLYFIVVIALIIGPTVYLAQLLYFQKEYSYSKLYVILAICWGMAMQLCMPPISGADEATHVTSAFHASNVMMGIGDEGVGDTQFDNQWIQGWSYWWLRECDIEGYIETDLTFPKQFEYIANGEWFHTEKTVLMPQYTATGEWYRYIPSAIGITIGRLLHFGYYGTIFLGRFMNTLLYVLIGWFAIKIMPIGKLQVIIFALLPTTLNLCNSYSYDNMSIMFSLLLFALILYYCRPEVKVHFWDLFIIAANVIILAPNKIVYAIFGIWIFAIPFRKWKDLILSKKWYEYAGLAVFFAVAHKAVWTIGWRYFFIARRYVFLKEEGASIEQFEGRESYTWKYFMENFDETMKFAWNGIKGDFWYNIKHCIGCELGMIKLNAPVNIRWTLLLLVLIFASYFIAGKGKKLGKQQIIMVIVGAVIVLACIFVGCLIRFTPTEGSLRVQVSYRYLIPVYMALMLIFGNDAKENKYALGIIYAENLTLLFTLTSVLTYLFTR